MANSHLEWFEPAAQVESLLLRVGQAERGGEQQISDKIGSVEADARGARHLKHQLELQSSLLEVEKHLLRGSGGSRLQTPLAPRGNLVWNLVWNLGYHLLRAEP